MLLDFVSEAVAMRSSAYKLLTNMRLQGSGGEGGIRTPDRLTPMSDFESGAFNRALPPLRTVYNNLRDTLDPILFPVSVLVSLSFPADTSRSRADA